MSEYNTLEKRIEFVEKFRQELVSQFAVQTYQVWIFGSFLTEEYNSSSDIDIGVYCDDSHMLMDIYEFIDNYMSLHALEHDIVIVEFIKSHYINIPIIMNGKALTEYEPDNWLEYMTEMISTWGTNPMVTLLERSKV